MLREQFQVAANELQVVIVNARQSGMIDVNEESLNKIMLLVKQSLEASFMKASLSIDKTLKRG
jgi:hypothetical protein